MEDFSGFRIGDVSSGENLTRQMKKKRMSQRTLSAKTSISSTTIRGLMSGKRDGNLATWAAIARALGCELSDIIAIRPQERT